ncbi:DUF374 domain-containing protein [bacterium]|nr:MAG: DUF374 domain-containing protein [bacterium]
MKGSEKEHVDLSARLLSGLGGIFFRGVEATVRLQVIGSEHLDERESEGVITVLPFFHGRLFLLPSNFNKRKIAILASMSRDGEIISRVLEGFGFRMVRGSTSRGGAKGLIGLKRAMTEGYHASTPVDGPRGPLNVVKPGVVYLAKKAGSPVVPVAVSARPAFIFHRAWDNFMLPLPFSRGVILYGKPLYFDSNLSEEAVERDRATLQKTMLDLYAEADEMVGYKDSGK